MPATASKAMRIVVFGGLGDVGRRMVDEGARRGHRMSVVSRRGPGAGEGGGRSVRVIERDVLSADDLDEVVAEHDGVISALRPRDGQEETLVGLTSRVVEAAVSAGRRFVVVGGAACLRLPDDPAHTVLTAPGFLPESVVPIARACQAQHDWVVPRLGELGAYLCPPAMLSAGERTGVYRVGEGTLVTDEEGVSRISMEDFAVAAIDELERPAHAGRRFTVGV